MVRRHEQRHDDGDGQLGLGFVDDQLHVPLTRQGFRSGLVSRSSGRSKQARRRYEGPIRSGGRLLCPACHRPLNVSGSAVWCHICVYVARVEDVPAPLLNRGSPCP